LGADRIAYADNHIECDNRLTWFLPRLTKRYGDSSVLVIVERARQKTAASYNRRWERINIMKAYSQGILMRGLHDNTYEVCEDYVENVYEQLEFFSHSWKHVVHLQLEEPSEGVDKVLSLLDKSSHKQEVLEVLSSTVLNLNKARGFKRKYKVFKYNWNCLVSDLKR